MNKSYSDFMDEITADELYEGLLGYGLFSDKLPPVFSSVGFYDYCKANTPNIDKSWHDVVSHSSMRNVLIPRQFGISTPMKYDKLCRVLRDNWPLLKKHFREQTVANSYRVSRIHLRKQKNSKKLFEMNYKDCLYITQGTKVVTFKSLDPEKPAKFYMVSAPAHCAYTTTLIPIEKANKRPLGAMETSNKRVINQFIHPDVLKTCQLSMGMTVLEPGSVWNTMPAHTHERRMEIYMYFEIPKDNVVFHMMGEGNETRHIVMQNEEAVISPSWSIHAGAGTSNYTFIWAMGGENQAFDDMDNIPTTELR